MSSFPDKFSSQTDPLNAAVLGPQARQALEQLAEQGYEVHTGLTTELADTIATMALEPNIKEYCPNDSGKRFANLEATKEWLSKERGTFLLLKRGEDGSLQMVGYGWAGAGSSSHVPGGQTTFAIRIGEAGQGQGLATLFARLIVSGATALYEASNMWLETWQSNGSAVHVYHKIGFTDVDQEDDQRLSGSGKRVPDTRLYMSLPNEQLNS